MCIDGNNSSTAAANEADAQELTFYKFVINSLPTAVLTVNADLKITGFNPWAEKVTGYSAVEALGSSCGEILQGGMCKTNCPLKTVLRGNSTVSLLTTTIRNKQGKMIPVRLNTAGLFDDNRKLVGGVESFQDISIIKALEREKGNIISMFAHDMKSSLTIIGGFVLRLLRMGSGVEEKKQKKYLNIVKEEAGKLEFLVDDFLEFSRLQLGKLQLNIGPTSLDKQLMELFDAYHVKALKHDITLRLENTNELPIISVDENRLRRVFTNLLDNALKFSPKGGTITVSTHEGNQEITIKIIDQGVGIDPADIPYIFDTFHRGQNSDKKQGHGLGLAGVKAIVEGHGGRVHVESELGKGSTFTVVLPKGFEKHHNSKQKKDS